MWRNFGSGSTLDASWQAESGTGFGTSYARLICLPGIGRRLLARAGSQILAGNVGKKPL